MQLPDLRRVTSPIIAAQNEMSPTFPAKRGGGAISIGTCMTYDEHDPPIDELALALGRLELGRVQPTERSEPKIIVVPYPAATATQRRETRT